MLMSVSVVRTLDAAHHLREVLFALMVDPRPDMPYWWETIGLLERLGIKC